MRSEIQGRMTKSKFARFLEYQSANFKGPKPLSSDWRILLNPKI